MTLVFTQINDALVSKLKNYSLIIVEDLQLLPTAFFKKHKAKVVFDAREYYPLQNEESFFGELLSNQTEYACVVNIYQGWI